MCLAVPSKVIEIEGDQAVVDVDGVTRKANLMLLEGVSIGDYVIVHAGFAINKVDRNAAKQTLEDLRGILAAHDGRNLNSD